MDAQNVALPLCAVTAFILIYLLRPHRNDRNPKSQFPPGPTINGMPTYDSWLQYREWGPLVYIHSQNVLIINHLQVATDLLEDRARIYSDRETSVMLDLSGLADFILGMQRYSDKWRKHRKVFQQNFRQATISCFHPTQYKEVHLFLRAMITAPSNFMQHTMALSQRTIYSAIYGLDIDPDDDIARKTAEVVQGIFSVILLNGAFPVVERFPWLRHLPSWFPGCHFKRLTDRSRQRLMEAKTIPFDLAVNNLKTGSKTSLIAELASQHEGNPEMIEAIQAMGTTSSLAGADTVRDSSLQLDIAACMYQTAGSIGSFLLAMVMHPDAQVKGQEEIDRVVGKDRLPTFEDRQSLPFVESIYQEVMRLDPPVPLGVSHASIEDDFYRGYHIPKGCVIIPNVWAMNRDPELYPEPDKFLPDRFFNSPEGPFIGVRNIPAFGFGRRFFFLSPDYKSLLKLYRVCSGRYMADNTVWLAIVSVLATLTLGKAKDDEGKEIDISGEFSHGFFRHPEPYKCSIVPRTLLAKELILATKGFE
ncbi:hypothetical protein GYMLUDRAFT_239665 [Collybiopsis luxurians FD-317 M1]|nr:hypothetical protein GYMLUDRAFT_239665 [Collybiopsis luxurians FD-317 M1]